MLVRATALGFLHWVRHVGEEFEIKEHHFAKEWMEKIDPPPAPAPAFVDEPEPVVAAEPVTEVKP